MVDATFATDSFTSAFTFPPQLEGLVTLRGESRLEGHKNDSRRSTRLSRNVPIVITSIDETCKFSGQYETVVVNAHGCGVIVREFLVKGTPVRVEVASNGRSK